jgi:hypothetical protein
MLETNEIFANATHGVLAIKVDIKLFLAHFCRVGSRTFEKIKSTRMASLGFA